MKQPGFCLLLTVLLLCGSVCPSFIQLAMPLDAGSGSSGQAQMDSSGGGQEDTMIRIQLTIGEQSFTTWLYDTPTTEAFVEQLPLQLTMRELNGNEKYHYLEQALPTQAEQPQHIACGDLMLYGNNCLVLFYESFATSYSYTPLGYVEEKEGLAAVVGNGSVQVSFQLDVRE